MRRDPKTRSRGEAGSFTRRRFLQVTSAAAMFPIGHPVLQAMGQMTAAGGIVSPASAPVHGHLGPARALMPEEAAIAREIADGIKYRFASAVSQHGARTFAPGSYEWIAQAYLKKQKPERQASSRRRAAALLNAPVSERQKAFGRFANAGDTQPQIVDPALKAKMADAVKKEATLREGLAGLAGGKVSTGPTVVPAYSKLGFFIYNVRCNEETDELSASDEILLGGFGVSPSGKMIEVPQWKVSDDFDRGEVVTYAPPRNFVEFDLFAKGDFPFPRTYTISLVMGEEDSGGFGDFLQAIWDKVGAEAVAAASSAIGLAAGTAVGSALGGFIGAIAGAVIGTVIGWLIQLFDNPDDLVGVNTWTLTLLNPAKAYFDSLPGVNGGSAPTGVMNFQGDGGNYDVTLNWAVYN